MSANQQGGGRFDPNKYERVDDRIMAFRRDYPGVLGRIITIPQHKEDWIAFEAEIWARDAGDPDGQLVVIANGHAYDRWGQPSQAEKTEKAAIGRALVMAGYSASKDASAEEMERHNDQEERGAPTPLRRNTPQTAQNAPDRSETREQVSDSQPAQNNPAKPAPTPWDKLDKTKLPPAYVSIIDKARGMVDEGASYGDIEKFLKSKKRAMSDREYTDAQYRLGEIKQLIADLDNAEAVRAELVPGARQELIDKAVRAVRGSRGAEPDDSDPDF